MKIEEQKVNLFTYFFWWCSGSEVHILKKLPTEKNKYFGIGATIVGTAVMATAGGSYAFFIIFKSYFKAILFGFMWGLLIFNLDRYITSSMKKRNISIEHYFLSERFYNFVLELMPAIPRIFIAIIIGIIISKPIELKLFESEINEKINILHDEAFSKKRERLKYYDVKIDEVKNEIEQVDNNFINSLNKKMESLDYYDDRINELQKENKDRRSTLENLWQEVLSIRRSLQSEIIGTGESKKEGYGPIARRIDKTLKETEKRYYDFKENVIETTKKNNSDINQAKKERAKRLEEINEWSILSESEFKEKIKIKEDEIIKLQLEKDSETNKFKENLSDGILIKIKALSDLTDNHISIKWANILVILLICLIESAPIIVKLITERGPYDAMIDNLNKTTMHNLDKNTYLS